MSKAARLKRERPAKEAKRRRWAEHEMVYVFKGRSNATSYNHTSPKSYRTKDERPNVTGVWLEDNNGPAATYMSHLFQKRSSGSVGRRDDWGDVRVLRG